MPNSMPNKIWENNAIQFPRLIAEINATVDFSEEDWEALCQSMDLSDDDLNELFDRAVAEWDQMKRKMRGERTDG